MLHVLSLVVAPVWFIVTLVRTTVLALSRRRRVEGRKQDYQKHVMVSVAVTIVAFILGEHMVGWVWLITTIPSCTSIVIIETHRRKILNACRR